MDKSSAKSSFIDISLAYHAAESAVQSGHDLLLSYYGKIKNIEIKEKAGLVSEADKESEKLIQKMLHEKCPQFHFLGEETSYAEGVDDFTPSDHPRWILDPLDGTTNFIHQLPIFCISLALEVNQEIVLGIIDVPILGQTFTAIKGQGAFCKSADGKKEKISVSSCTKISDAFMTTGFINEEKSVLQEQLKIFNHFVWKARGIRRPGAAAYDLAMVASGVFDLYWEKNIKPWDAAAGILLVQEAGGVCRTYENQPYHAFKKSLVAGSDTIVQPFLQELQHVLH